MIRLVMSLSTFPKLPKQETCFLELNKCKAESNNGFNIYSGESWEEDYRYQLEPLVFYLLENSDPDQEIEIIPLCTNRVNADENVELLQPGQKKNREEQLDKGEKEKKGFFARLFSRSEKKAEIDETVSENNIIHISPMNYFKESV